MHGDQGARRRFLKTASAGLAGGAWLAMPDRAFSADGETGIHAVYDVRTFGAKGDGKALDSPALNKAIEAAAADGGGTVWVRAGTYRCYSIHLKSDVDLYLAPGSVVLASDSPAEAEATISLNRTSLGKTIRISVTITGTTA